MTHLKIKIETENPSEKTNSSSFVTFEENWSWEDSNIKPFELFEKLVDLVERERRGQTSHSNAFDG